MIHTQFAMEVRSRRVNGHVLPVKRRRKGHTPSAETRAKIAATMRGNDNGAMYGKARKVGEWEPRPLFVQMGELIRDARMAADVALSELSAATGIHVATLSRIENGKSLRARNRGARLETVIKIALALGVRPYEVMP